MWQPPPPCGTESQPGGTTENKRFGRQNQGRWANHGSGPHRQASHWGRARSSSGWMRFFLVVMWAPWLGYSSRPGGMEDGGLGTCALGRMSRRGCGVGQWTHVGKTRERRRCARSFYLDGRDEAGPSHEVRVVVAWGPFRRWPPAWRCVQRKTAMVGGSRQCVVRGCRQGGGGTWGEKGENRPSISGVSEAK